MCHVKFSRPKKVFYIGKKNNICVHCGKDYEYLLKTEEDVSIHLCEDCDENYGLCAVCGYPKFNDELSYTNESDEYKTCEKCRSKIY